MNIEPDPARIRHFPSGATRNASDTKLEYARFFDPAVLHEFAKYMHGHRVLADGTLREPDNWKKGIPDQEYLASLARHFWELWLWLDALPGHSPLAVRKEALNGILFNTMGLMHNALQSNPQKELPHG